MEQRFLQRENRNGKLQREKEKLKKKKLFWFRVMERNEIGESESYEGTFLRCYNWF